VNVNLALIAALAPLTTKLTGLVKYLSARQWRDAVTTLVPWVGAFVALEVGAHADLTRDLVLFDGGPALGKAAVGSLVLASAVVGSAGSLLADFRKAVDNTDTAVEPKLGGPPSP
jgi:hypothetical protein